MSSAKKNKFIWSLLFSLCLTSCHSSLIAKHAPIAEARSKTESVEPKSVQSERSRDLHRVIDLPRDVADQQSIEVAPVISSKLKQSMRFSSTVESSNPGTASVTSLMHGVVTRVLVDVGDTVKAGQIVAFINCPELSDAQSNFVERQALVLEATANVELVRTRVRLAEAEAARLKTLFDEGISAKKELEASQSRIAGTKAELETAKAHLAASEIQFCSAGSRLGSLGFDIKSVAVDKLTTELALRSPITGVVSQRNTQPGQTVGAAGSATTTVLFTIVDLSKVWVMLEVPQSEIYQIKLNAPVTFTTEIAPGQKFKGRVTRLGERFDSQSRTASVRTEIDNPKMILKPGLLVLAEVVTSTPSPAQLLVPNSAIQRISGAALIFKKVSATRFEACPIKLGDTDGQDTVVLSGVSAGDLVATKGSFLLKSELQRKSIGGGG
ncbi:MAG: efflux RND transporter periplasmic adaptor subunit [Candidatus Melainabacteria bacterium]|nr:efflux RND transporter periplasmic adaptor subunit [Candidatus Melainabacteria bacterium]